MTYLVLLITNEVTKRIKESKWLGEREREKEEESERERMCVRDNREIVRGSTCERHERVGV